MWVPDAINQKFGLYRLIYLLHHALRSFACVTESFSVFQSILSLYPSRKASRDSFEKSPLVKAYRVREHLHFASVKQFFRGF